MNVEAIARPASWREVPWAVWVLLVIACLIVARALSQGTFSIFGTPAFAAPVLFAAAVIYAAPRDRRFLWAALALAAPPAITIFTVWFPDVWFSVVPGDWKNATPLLRDMGDGARQLASIGGLIGLALFGIALGGVRTFMSALVLAFGTVVALANVSWVVTNSIDALPLLLLVQSVGLAVLHVIGWAFVFAAALESLRVLTLTGTGLIFANLVITALVTVWLPGGAGFEALFVVIAMPSLIGWGLLIVAALRGELTDAPPRSRAVRGNGALRRAG